MDIIFKFTYIFSFINTYTHVSSSNWVALITVGTYFLDQIEMFLFYSGCMGFHIYDPCLCCVSYVSVVSHDSASKECRRKMGEAYALNKALNGLVSEDDLKNLRRKLDESEEQGTKAKKSRQLLIG